MSDEMSVPWLQEGDQLFIEGDDWYHNALLHIFSRGEGEANVEQADASELAVYIAGYKEAGDRLVQSVMEDRAHQDTLVYPTVLLYRQYLELSLKQLIREGNQLLRTPFKWGPVGFPRGHNLLILWDKACIEIFRDMGTKYESLYIPDHDLAMVRNLLAQFVEQDPDSYAFRYPTDMNNEPSFPGLHVINVRNLAELMEKLSNFFDGAATAISVHWDLEQEVSRYGEIYGGESSDFS